MKSPGIKISDEAIEDINQAFLWYENQSPGLGFDFIEILNNDFQHILSFSDSFPLVFKKLRKCVLKKFPFNIYYQIGTYKKEIKIVRVLHKGGKLE